MERHKDCIFAHEDTVRGLAYSPDGTRLASVGGDALKVWDVKRLMPHLVVRAAHSSGGPRTVAYSPNGRYLVTQARDRDTIWWDSNGQVVDRLPLGHRANVLFTPDSRHILTTDKDDCCRVLLYSMERASSLCLQAHTHAVRALAVSPDGNFIASGDEAGVVKVWDMTATKELPHFNMGSVVLALAFDTQSRILAVSDSNFNLTFMPVGKPAERTATNWSGHEQHSICYSAECLATASYDGRCYVFEAGTLKKAEALTGHGSQVCCVAFSPDGKYLASGSKDHTIRIWNIKKPHHVS